MLGLLEINVNGGKAVQITGQKVGWIAFLGGQARPIMATEVYWYMLNCLRFQIDLCPSRPPKISIVIPLFISPSNILLTKYSKDQASSRSHSKTMPLAM